MPVYYMDEIPKYSFYERRLPNGEYRYEGYTTYGIYYCIDTPTRRTEEEINNWLDSRSVDYLIDNERYIINLK